MIRDTTNKTNTDVGGPLQATILEAVSEPASDGRCRGQGARRRSDALGPAQGHVGRRRLLAVRARVPRGRNDPKRWRDAEVAALFAPPNANSPAGVRDWTTADLISRWQRSWACLLEGGRARPRDVAGRIRSTFLGAHQVSTFPEYELRAIAVEPLDYLERLRFDDDGWPVRAPRRAGGLGLHDLLDA
ncbi:hypothetical protein [Capillimicrobium parvum]|uniref:hypothetical protein n=1 Tax=Capillimicrobium parvum TaxID=2884022 RepID=UPI00216B5B31|nr:hypothetical protein [Capillimicrobium parvum]